MRARSALLVCLLFGCKSGPAPGPGTSAASDPKAEGAGRQQDEQTIREAEARWRKTLAARDTAAIASFYTQDAVYAPQGYPAYRGRNSVSARWSWEFGAPGFQLERTPLRIEVANSGDVATEVGTYVVRFRVKGQPHKGTGTYMTAWRKTDGQWRIASYMWNRDQEGRD